MPMLNKTQNLLYVTLLLVTSLQSAQQIIHWRTLSGMQHEATVPVGSNVGTLATHIRNQLGTPPEIDVHLILDGTDALAPNTALVPGTIYTICFVPNHYFEEFKSLLRRMVNATDEPDRLDTIQLIDEIRMPVYDIYEYLWTLSPVLFLAVYSNGSMKFALYNLNNQQRPLCILETPAEIQELVTIFQNLGLKSGINTYASI